MTKTDRGSLYYKDNDDVVITVAQCGDYIREHAGDLIGRVIGDRQRQRMSTDIRTTNIDITISIIPGAIPTINVNKDIQVPLTIPFAEDGE